MLEVDVGQHLLLGELDRLLLVARGELLVALDRGEHFVGDLLHELVGAELLLRGRAAGEKERCEECEELAHAVAFSLWEPLNIPGSSEWRSRRR